MFHAKQLSGVRKGSHCGFSSLHGRRGEGKGSGGSNQSGELPGKSTTSADGVFYSDQGAQYHENI